MKHFDNNKRMGALMAILVLAVGSISIIGTSQFVKGLDGGNINGSIIACVYGACKDNTFNGGTSGGGGGGGQPTPNTAKLIVTKEVKAGLMCGQPPHACSPSDFTMKVTGNNPSPSSFPGDNAGTTVTLGPGNYQVAEEVPFGSFTILFSGNCDLTGKGTINAGETQNCKVTNGP